MNVIRSCGLFVVLLFCQCLILGQNTSKANERLFAVEEPLELTVRTDLGRYLEDAWGNEPGDHPALLSYMDEGGEERQLEFELRARGHFRRDPSICNFPPTWFRFKKKKVKGTHFKGQKKLKLVTHCGTDQEILKEYYVYKVYNLLTPYSFRVRLAKITWVDIAGSVEEVTRFGFFIEDINRVAERNGAVALEDSVKLTADMADPECQTLVHVFNYLVANKDFDIRFRQNLKIVKTNSGAIMMVPYDFDWAGIVNADYTRLDHEKKHPFEERQIFKPLCREQEEFEQATGLILSNKEEIADMYQSSPWLDDVEKRETLKLYKKTFRSFSKSRFILKEMVDSCPAGG